MKLVNDVQKLGEIAGTLIAAHTYPAIIREKDVLETTAHLMWAVLRGEEPAAEIFGVSYATSYLEQVSPLNRQYEPFSCHQTRPVTVTSLSLAPNPLC